MGFQGRAQQHDDQAMPLVVTAFEKHGFQCFKLGTETDDDSAHQALMAQSDCTSIMLRYRPDRVFVKRGVRSVLCEVKSETKGYPNFAIEVDSFRAAHEWDHGNNRVLYALVDLSQSKPVILCCWAFDIAIPTTIKVPQRWDWKRNHERLRQEYPDTAFDFMSKWAGSGTPFFLLPKKYTKLVEIDAFVYRWLN